MTNITNLEVILQRYERFISELTKDTVPISVFEPLSEKQMEELNLIREISKDLQKKKEEDMRKAEAKPEESEDQKPAKLVEESKNGEKQDP